MEKNKLKLFYWFLTDREWRNRYLQSRGRQSRHNEARRKVMNKIASGHTAEILSGPFSRMKYIKSFNKEWFTQKVMGFYEYPLREVVEYICDTDYHLIIDVGAAEGYYACGLAYRKPDCKVVCFEADSFKHDAIRKIASINNCLDRIKIEGYCDSKTLTQELAATDGLKLLFLDCEGAEKDLLDPKFIHGLDKCDILVETHDFIVQGVTACLIERFSATHEIVVVENKGMPEGLLKLGSQFGIDYQTLTMAADELRSPGNGWLWMKTKQVSAIMSGS
jgi:hypothetical protein